MVICWFFCVNNGSNVLLMDTYLLFFYQPRSCAKKLERWQLHLFYNDLWGGFNQ